MIKVDTQYHYASDALLCSVGRQWCTCEAVFNQYGLAEHVSNATDSMDSDSDRRRLSIASDPVHNCGTAHEETAAVNTVTDGVKTNFAPACNNHDAGTPTHQAGSVTTESALTVVAVQVQFCTL